MGGNTSPACVSAVVKQTTMPVINNVRFIESNPLTDAVTASIGHSHKTNRITHADLSLPISRLYIRAKPRGVFPST